MIKKIAKILFLLIFCFSFSTKVYAFDYLNNDVFLMDMDYSTDYNRDDDMNTNCQDFAPTLKVVGVFIIIAKIALPLIIIAKSSMNFFSIVVKGDSGELKKQAQKLGTSLIAAVIIFLVPTIVNTIFGFIDSYNGNKTSDSEICRACLFDPYDPSCTNYADKAGN